jgi:hypothetical protein
MNKNIYPLFITLLFFSCSYYLPYSGGGQIKSITDIPLKKSVTSIDCFFNNQTPNKPFYKVKITEVAGSANASYDELIISLKNKALQEGLDGVIILDKQQEIAYENLNEKISVRDTTVDYYRQLAKPYQKLSAIGIKYAANINYLDTIVKVAQFEFASNANANNGTVNFDFYGNPNDIANKQLAGFYRDSIEPFDVERHLHFGIKGWQYKRDEILTKRVVAFKKEINDQVLINAKIIPEDTSSILYQIFNTGRTKKSSYILKVEKDFAGRVNKKILYQKNKLIWVEKISYEKNVMQGIKRYRLNNGEEQIIFTTSNQFYSVSDLPNPLNN